MNYFDESIVPLEKRKKFFQEEITSLRTIQLQTNDKGVTSDIASLIKKINGFPTMKQQ
jgi:hypothetical protein